MSTLDMVRDVLRRDEVFDLLKPDINPNLEVSKDIILYMEDVSVSFDGFKAINDLNL